MEQGREQPPVSSACSVPRPARRVAHAPMSAPECSLVRAVICAPNARVLSLANSPAIRCETRWTSTCTSRRSLSPEIDHHHDQDRAVLGVVKALAALDPAGCGLDDASAQLEGRTYVMADEAGPHFCIARRIGSRIVKISSVPITHPSAVRQTRRAAANALRAKFSALQHRLDCRAYLVREPRSTSSQRASVSASRHIHAHNPGAPAPGRRASSALHRITNVCIEFAGCPWSTSNMRIRGRSRFRSRVVGNCSARTRNR